MRQKPRALRGSVVYGVLVAGALVAFLSLASFLVVPIVTEHPADMRIEPAEGRVMVGDTFTVQVVVESEIPVNVFAGEVRFDHEVIYVDSIDYNTSIADLWAELPWYENGEGTVNFAGGTTRKGGFQGSGSLIDITFRAKIPANTALRLEEARILEHNGLGTDVPLGKPIDAILSVENSLLDEETIVTPNTSTVNLSVQQKNPTTDLNADGRQTIADVSIFMLNIFGNNSRFDFNLDEAVDTKDLSILLDAQ